MSGIIALLRHDRGPIDRELLARMTAAQRFRGPDGEATWIESTHANVGFGHTLHKATLEAEREHQPTTSRNGFFTITADARIDAREELCAKLRARGIDDAREDATDPDLILQAYEAWGEACVEHLLGDFSFALWDAREQKLFCAVDQLGVKPFFYADRGGAFAASNTLECVRMHPALRPQQLDEIAVGDFLLFSCYLDRERTIYEDIARLAPGHRLVVNRGELRLRRYFVMSEPDEACFKSERDCVEEFQDLLRKAVRDRLRTQQIAIYMSGGVDSTLVASVAKRELTNAFPSAALEAFTAVYDVLIPDDERHFTTLAANGLGIPVHFHSYDNADLFDWRALFLPPEPMDWPSASPAVRQSHEVAARFPVALTGWDGDALLRASLPATWTARLKARQLKTLARELTWYVWTQHGPPPIGFRSHIKRLRERKSPSTAPRWIDRGLSARVDLSRRWTERMQQAAATSPRGPSLQNLFAEPMWGPLLTQQDASFMRYPLEYRHPLADLRVVRFSLALPAVPWCFDKALLRRSLRDVPAEIRDRPKTPLQGDVDAERFRKGGLRLPPQRWRVDRLDGFVNTAAVVSALECPRAPEQLSMLLRAVALGVWLDGR